MVVPDGDSFCLYRDQAGRNHGISSRYTLICLIGVHRAKDAGYRTEFDTGRLFARALRECGDGVADIGLLLWAASQQGCEHTDGVFERLARRLRESPTPALTGMDLGLALSGLVAFARKSGSEEAIEAAREAKDLVLTRLRRPRAALFCHTTAAGWRRLLPNFASQAYLIHGLAQYALESQDFDAGRVAANCASRIQQLQRADGGWPWIYSVDGYAVEDYEIYSVHQDAMMPMALMALAEVDRADYRPAILRGLSWLDGGNALGRQMVDQEGGLILRSIRRKRVVDRAVLAANSAWGLAFSRPVIGDLGPLLELNTTCRPYLLGWLLYAWCGREDYLQVGKDSRFELAGATQQQPNH